jgi:DNA-binding winged helix-turn-helix (wHTH) protein
VVTFEFTPFVLDPAKRVLLRAGVPQPLTPRAFDLLLLLVQQRDRVLCKDEILRTVWADTVVEESNLNQQVFVLRKALNGDGHGTEYITTTPRRGYRFTADVRERCENDRPPAAIVETTPASSRGWSLRVLSLAAGLTAGGVLLAAILISSRSSAVDSEPQIRRVTALPGLEQFPSISPDGNFVVFSWSGTNPAAAPDLWIKEIDGDVMRRLTETPAAEVYPAWSPDGRDIAFVRGSAGVFIVSALGGPERHVFGSGSIVGWTRIADRCLSEIARTRVLMESCASSWRTAPGIRSPKRPREWATGRSTSLGMDNRWHLFGTNVRALAPFIRCQSRVASHDG